MTKKRGAFSHLQPWLGLAGGAIGWSLAHQIASNTIFEDCRAGDPAFVLLVGLGGLAIAGAGGLASFGLRRREGESEGRRFAALLSALLAALAAFAILLQSLSALILPECAG